MTAASDSPGAPAPDVIALPGCLVLAAGSHRRFGPSKLLQPLADGRALILHTLDALKASGLPVALVHRPDDVALLDQIDATTIQLIPNPDHAAGLGHSIACGVRATADWNGWIVCLADMPAVHSDTVRAIAAALPTHPIVIPHFQGQPGHPRGFQRRFFPLLSHLHGDRGARDLLAQHSAEIGVLHVPDAGILLDIDYPEDLHNLGHLNPGYPDSNAPLKGLPHDMTEPQNKPEQDSASATSAAIHPETSAPAAPIPASDDTGQNEPVAIATPDVLAEKVPAEETPAEIPAAAAVETVAEVAAVEAPGAEETIAAVAVEPPSSDAETAAETIAAPAVEVETVAPAIAATAAIAAVAETVADAAEAPTETVADTGTEITPVAVTPAAPVVPAVRFSELPLDPRIQQAVVDMGFEYCTPIQALALPRSLLGKDVIGKAQTGTGKTAAFLITVINHLLTVPEQEERYNGEPRAFILAPTRELAIQIEKDAKALIKHTPLTLMSIVGGMDYQKQQRRLQNEIIDIVVGTPGRLIDFVRNKDLFLSETEIVVIDEADRMLDMGFIPDVKRLVRETPFKEYRQTLMFSATFTQDILNLSGSWTRNAEHLEVANENAAADTVDQKVYIVTTEEKFTLLYNLIDQQQLERVMIFANRRDETRDLTHKLRDYGIKCAMLSGEVPQEKRIKVLEGFREGRIRVLVATDVAGRGIHIDDITFVVNYTLPEDPEDYVHRIGRTGRAGKLGTSISFACEEDAFQLPAIEKLLGAKLDCSQPAPELLTEIPPPVITPEQLRERESHNHNRRRRPPRRQSGNR